MRYIGSKRRLVKHIMPIILKDRKEGQWYVEPFVGGGNSFQEVCNPRLGSDVNRHAVSALLAIRDTPELLPGKASDISVEDYKRIKKYQEHPLHGYIAFACSFGGKYFGGRIKEDYGDGIDSVKAQYNAAQITSTKLQGSVIKTCKYQELEIPPSSIIYCDPPYEGTQGYGMNFNHEEFWQWCREKALEGHKVFISEYKAPPDFECLWEKESTVTLRSDSNNQKSVERLFTLSLL